jgi:hypothetical protein
MEKGIAKVNKILINHLIDKPDLIMVNMMVIRGL